MNRAAWPFKQMACCLFLVWLFLTPLFCGASGQDRPLAPTTGKTTHDRPLLNLTNLPTRRHQGITIVAFPVSPGKTAPLPSMGGHQAIEKIRQGYDYLQRHSPHAVKIVARLKASGQVWIIFSPSFPARRDPQESATTFALFNPDLVLQAGGGKNYAVIIGYHLIQWPPEELAWVLGHELVGHGLQHMQNRLGTSRLNDLECEAFLHQEQVAQELGLWKSSDLMVKVRQQMEEKWCLAFRQYMHNKDPKKMKLWDVLNMDIMELH